MLAKAQWSRPPSREWEDSGTRCPPPCAVKAKGKGIAPSPPIFLGPRKVRCRPGGCSGWSGYLEFSAPDEVLCRGNVPSGGQSGSYCYPIRPSSIAAAGPVRDCDKRGLRV